MMGTEWWLEPHLPAIAQWFTERASKDAGSS
jgi:hypothetical protein